MSPFFITLLLLLQYSLADDYYCADYIEVSNYYGFDCRNNGGMMYWCSTNMCPKPCDTCVYGESFMEGCGGTSPGHCRQCTVCGPGTQDITGCFSYPGYGSQDSTCIACEAGSFSYEVRNSYCQACMEGTYSNVGASSCTPCSPGTYQGWMQMSYCDACDQGFYQPGYGATSCLPCEDCPVGYYRSGCSWDSAGECLPCTNQE